MVAEGALKPVVGGRYPMSAVREAHQDLLARRTTGKLVLDPTLTESRDGRTIPQTRRLVQSRLRTRADQREQDAAAHEPVADVLRLGRVADLAAEVGVDLLQLRGAGRLAVAAAGLVGDLLERRPVDRHRHGLAVEVEGAVVGAEGDRRHRDAGGLGRVDRLGVRAGPTVLEPSDSSTIRAGGGLLVAGAEASTGSSRWRSAR